MNLINKSYAIILTLLLLFSLTQCKETVTERSDRYAKQAAALALLKSEGRSGFKIQGTISGLNSTGLVIQNNGGDDLAIENGATNFIFSKLIPVAERYEVTIKTQPIGLNCLAYSNFGYANTDIDNIQIKCVNSYKVGGTITGLTASGLVLRNNGEDDLTVVSGATSFTFAKEIREGREYAVTIGTQPQGLNCTVNNGTGSVTANVNNISVVCVSYSIGGTITGLAASGLVLQNNGGDDLTVDTGATSFTFPTRVIGAYAVTVKTQPTGLSCSVSSGSGTATANISNVSITCVSTYSIGGTITGLTASGLVLQNNGGDDLTVDTGATSFTFPTRVIGAYAVTVKTQPTGLSCAVSSGSGTATTDISNVSITCISSYSIGGTITGLTASGLVLQNNGGDDLIVKTGATTFIFPTRYGVYAVTVKTQPTGLSCAVSSGSGTATTDISNVSITCISSYSIGGTITGLTASGLVLQNNGGDDRTVPSGATSFTFATKIAPGAAYAVTIKTQPLDLTCTVSNATGTATAIVMNVTLACVGNGTIIRNWGVFTDNNNGTVKFEGVAGTFGGQTYTAQTLTWMKCSHGQAWKSSTNDCKQNGTAGDNYGVTAVKYCSVADQSCNDTGTGLLNGSGISTAYTACNDLNAGAGTYGKTNWRVPTKNELKLLINCGSGAIPDDTGNCGSSTTAINTYFPNTVGDSYWSSITYVGNTNLAWVVRFNGGYTAIFQKTFTSYVRCVSGP